VTLPSIGKGLSDVDLTGSFIPGSTTSDQALKSSIMYGGKIGHYFRAAPWFGLEAEIYRTTPHIKHQTVEFRGPNGPVGSRRAGRRPYERPYTCTAESQLPLP
jgi:hypothetical protein